MKEYTASMLAVSRAGHDKDTVYVVLGSDDTYLWLADGKRRRLENPKKKKLMHVQIVKHLPAQLTEQMQSITLDAHIRTIIKTYRELQEI